MCVKRNKNHFATGLCILTISKPGQCALSIDGVVASLCRLATALCFSLVLVPAGDWAPAIHWALLAGKVVHLAVLPLGLRLPFLQDVVVQALSVAANLPSMGNYCVNIMASHGGRQLGHFLETAAEVLSPCKNLRCFALAHRHKVIAGIYLCMNQEDMNTITLFGDIPYAAVTRRHSSHVVIFS